MKEFKIGKKTYNQIESGYDINNARCKEFTAYLLQAFQQINTPIWIPVWEKIKTLHSKGSHAEVIITLDNFNTGLKFKDLDFDCFSICFALLNLSENEDQLNFSRESQEDKLVEMNANGLNRGVVVETVINFIKTSPEQFGTFLMAMEGLNQILTEDE